MPSIPIDENDNIYIDCQPVELVNPQEEPPNKTFSDFLENIFDSQTSNKKDKSGKAYNLYENPGIQTIIGIGLFGFLITISNFFFYKLPSNKLEKEILKN